MKRVPVRLGVRSYEVVIGAPLTGLARWLASKTAPGTKVLVMTDRNVQVRYGTRLTRALRNKGFETHGVTLAPGEQTKSLAHAVQLYRRCAALALERSSWIVALGGGVIGDLAGFVAATYLRGVPLVQVPTTLLAQVDAAIGGKTGINLPEGKNLVGAFYQPRLVWMDLSVLRTLPEEQFRNGLAEVIKYGVIRDARLFSFLEKNARRLLARDPAVLAVAVRRCAAIKAGIVSQDEREQTGLRQVLNFGHTLGHAVEAAVGYQEFLHGEAVSIGMFAACFMAEQMRLLPTVDRIRLGTLLGQVGLPIRSRRKVPREKVLYHLARDKKVKATQVQFVLPERIGKVRTGQVVPPPILELALQAVGL